MLLFRRSAPATLGIPMQALGPASVAWLLALLLPAQNSEVTAGARREREAESHKEAIRQFHAGWAHGSTAERVQAVKALAQIADPEVAQVLAAKLPEPSPLVRKEVADALAKLKEPKTIPALGTALQRELEKDGSLDTLRAICQALGATNDPRAIAPLTLNLFGGNRREEGWEDRVKARLDALGMIRHKDAVDELIALFGRTGGGGGRRMGGGTNASDQRIVQTIRANLRKLTNQDHGDQNEWRKWWRETRETFRF